MRWSSCRRVGAAVLLGAILLALSACTTNPEGPPLVMGHSVRGKVTYRGEPVAFGCVQFFSLGHSADQKTRMNIPLAIAEIHDGKYEMPNAPEGPVQVAVVTDPDMDLAQMMRPTPIGHTGHPGVGAPVGGPPGLPPVGGPPGLPPGGPPGGPPGVPIGGPNDRGAGQPPPLNGPGAAPDGSLPVAPGAPKLVGAPVLPKPGNPQAEKLTAAQKAVLKDIHAKYSNAVESKLVYVVRPGDGEQTYDLELK
jgi:hypothetical protein